MNVRIKMAIAAMIAICLAASLGAAESGTKVTSKDQDGYILFYLSWENAHTQKDPTVVLSGEPGNETAHYANHVLSCGTWMNGQLETVTKDGKIQIKGAFDVTNNPFNISSLSVDLTKPAGGGAWTGTIIVDGRTCIVEGSSVKRIKND